MKRAFPAVFLLLAVAGCAADDVSYPSLALRPVEKIDLAEPAPEPEASVAPDPALDAEIAAAVAKREQAARQFDAVASRVERQVHGARGAAVGSSAWLDAQVALAGLDEARSSHAAAVEALEEVGARRAQTLAPPYPALERALDDARSAGDAQTRRADAIAAMLPAG